MAIVTDGLVLYLHGACGKNNPATRVWKDLSGNGNDGELMNFNFTEDSGWVDGGLKFDGVDDYVDCGNGDSLNITEDLTIEMVVKINPGDNVGGICKGNYGGWVANSYGIRSTSSTNKNSYYFFISDGANLNKVLIPNIDNGSWLHIVGTTSKAEMNLKTYRNGVFEGTSERSIDNILINYNSLEVGTYYAKARTRGVFKLVRIYNRALTDEEIIQNYQAGHEWTPQIGKREVITTMKPITSSLSRKGTGKRELITTVKPITTSLERKGVGKREVISTMKPITSELNRKGVGRREVITTVRPITSSISKKLPPIHAEISTKERNPNITTRERIPKLEVD